MRVFVTLISTLAFTACIPKDIEGLPCQEDSTCGKGFDCFQKQCTKICRQQDQCSPNQVCFEHHCVHPSIQSQPHPKTPDPIAAELRALRVEVEKLRRAYEQLAQTTQRE